MIFKNIINQKNFLILIWLSFFSININPEEFFKIDIVTKLRLLSPLILFVLYLSIYGLKINFKPKKFNCISILFYFI